MTGSAEDHVKTTAERMRELEEDLQRLNEEYALELNLLSGPPQTLHSAGVPSSSMDRPTSIDLQRKDSSSSDDEEIRRRVRAQRQSAASAGEGGEHSDAATAVSRWTLAQNGTQNGTPVPNEVRPPESAQPSRAKDARALNDAAVSSASIDSKALIPKPMVLSGRMYARSKESGVSAVGGVVVGRRPGAQVVAGDTAGGTGAGNRSGEEGSTAGLLPEEEDAGHGVAFQSRYRQNLRERAARRKEVAGSIRRELPNAIVPLRSGGAPKLDAMTSAEACEDTDAAREGAHHRVRPACQKEPGAWDWADKAEPDGADRVDDSEGVAGVAPRPPVRRASVHAHPTQAQQDSPRSMHAGGMQGATPEKRGWASSLKNLLLCVAPRSSARGNVQDQQAKYGPGGTLRDTAPGASGGGAGRKRGDGDVPGWCVGRRAPPVSPAGLTAWDGEVPEFREKPPTTWGQQSPSAARDRGAWGSDSFGPGGTLSGWASRRGAEVEVAGPHGDPRGDASASARTARPAEEVECAKGEVVVR